MTQSRIVACPTCAKLNRLPADRLGAGGTCGNCHGKLFQAAPVVLTAANFAAHAEKSEIPLLVDFWASWCGPCRQMAPAFARAAAQLEPYMRLGKLDTEAEPAIAGRYAIRSIRTMDPHLEGARGRPPVRGDARDRNRRLGAPGARRRLIRPAAF